MADDVTFDAIWDEAVTKYIAATNKTPEDKKFLLSLKSTEDLLEQIEKESTRFSSFRSKKAKFRNVLSKSVRPFLALSDIASSALSLTPFAPASTVLGAVVFLVKAAGGVSESYDWIEELFEKLGGFTERLEQYVNARMHKRLRAKVIAILTCLLEIFARAETVMKTGRFKKYAAVLFLGQDDEVKASFGKLAKLFDDEHVLVQAITYATTQRIEQKAMEIDETTKQTLEATEEMQKKLDDLSSTAKSAEVKALLNDNLLTPAYNRNAIVYNEYTESIIEKTGDWLLQDSNVIRWRKKEIPLLWVFGGPGTGKSCLSSTLVRSLREEFPQDPKHPNRTSVVYFFTKEDDLLQDVSDLLKTLALQISHNDPIFKVFAANVLARPDSIATPKLLWKNLFINFYKQDRSLANNVLIILDGLDEVPRATVKELFALLEDITDRKALGNRLSCAIFSRPDISEFLEPKFSRIMTKVEIGNRNEGDIAQYIKKRLTDVLVVKQTKQLRDKKAAAKLAREIRERVLDKADGMFFKVVLIMDQIHDKERKNAVFDAIKEAPPQLDAMIAHVFEKLMLNEDVDKDDLNELLLWVAFAKAEISVNQLYAILKFRTGDAHVALEARLRGKFASIFKLNGGSELTEGSGPDPSPPAEATNNGNQEQKADDDSDDDFDIDEFSDDETDNETGAADLGDPVAPESNPFLEVSKDTRMRWIQIRVRFTHASIRDFLVQPRAPGSVGVHVNPRLADLHILDTCIKRILQYPTDPNRSNEQPDFIGYSARNWIEHLKAASDIDLTDPEKADVLKTIVGLLSDVEALKGLARCMAVARQQGQLLYLVKSPAFALMIRTKWLPAARQEDYSAEQWEWIQKSKESSKEFFRPLANAAAILWLQRSGPDDDLYEDRWLIQYFLWILWAWVMLDDSDPSAIEALNLSPMYSCNDPDFDEAVYEKVCNSFDSEKTEYWYCAHGWLLKNAYEIPRAVEMFERALEINSSCWDAHAGLGWCRQDEDFDEAKRCMDKAMENIPSSLKVMRLRLKSNIMGFMFDKEDHEGVAKWAGESYNPNPSDVNIGEFQLTLTYIAALSALHRWDRIHEILEDYARLPVQQAMTIFIGLCMVRREIGIPLYIRGDAVQITQPWIDELMKNVYLTASLPWSLVWCAEFMCDFYPTSEAALELLERIVTPTFSESLGEEFRGKFEESRDSMEDMLASIYAEKAWAAHRAGSDPKDWISKLTSLALADESNSIYRINSASMLLATFLRATGKAPSRWKPCIRPTMLEGIDILCDDDPGNDLDGYLDLTNALMAAGDYENTLAANVPCGLALHYEEDVLEAMVESGLQKCIYSCEGICTQRSFGDKEVDYKELWACTTCYDMEFCEECIVMVKDGKLPLRKCGKDHEFVKILPVPEELRERSVEWNAEKKIIEVKKEWLDELRKEWL